MATEFDDIYVRLTYAYAAYTLAMSTATKSMRLAVRMTSEQKRSIERAAEALGRNVTDFSVQVLTERAEEVLADRRVFSVDAVQWDQFLRQLDEPAPPVQELVDLMKRPSVFEE